MRRLLFITLLVILICAPKSALAIPLLQVYIEGSTAGNLGEDQETWLKGHTNPFNLHVVGAYKDYSSITEVTLLATVPQGQFGTMTVGGSGAGTRYDTLSFLPPTTPSLNHFPLNKSGLYDFYTFNLGGLANNTTGLNNYDASDGMITFAPNENGEDKIFNATVTGYDYVHFDVYAKFTDDEENSSWKANRGSHDAAIHGAPEPASMALVGLGLTGLAVLKRRKRRQ